MANWNPDEIPFGYAIRVHAIMKSQQEHGGETDG